MAASDPNAPWLTGTSALPVAIAAGLFVWFAGMLPEIAAGEALRASWAWAPSLGLNLSFWVDGLSLTFALLISGIGALVLLYSAKYLAGHHHFARFVGFLTAFMLSMLGLVLADNLLTLFVFWELTTITSYLLIGFDHATTKGRRSALQALLITGIGGLALLAGIVLIGNVGGTFELSELRANGDLTGHALYLPILLLVLAGAFTKSAQVPFHFWLPNAMAAPTPVSAYLHSATMVKAGIYLLARLHPNLSGTDVWLWTLTIIGGLTAVWASILALKQTDLKQALAYTTLMALGTLTMMLGSDVPYAITAAMTFLVTHSLYKAALFLVVGVVDHGTGTRDANVLSGLRRAMPVTATAAALAALSMAGLPPLIGFIAKEVQYAAGLRIEDLGTYVIIMALLANAMMFAVGGIVALKPFWGQLGETPTKPHEGTWPMLAGPVILSVLGLLFGLLPWLAQDFFVHPGVAAILGSTEGASTLKLWAGVNLPLFLSLGTFALGAIIYARHVALRGWLNRAGNYIWVMDPIWDKILDNFKAFAAWQTRIIQPGALTAYLTATFAVLLAAVGGTLVWVGMGEVTPDFSDIDLRQWAVVLLIFGGTLVTVFTSSRITAIAGLGVVGIGVALIFILYGAPDVAITQLLVETLVVVLFAVAALRLPSLAPMPGPGRLWINAGLSVGLGVVMAGVLMRVTTGDIDRRLTDFFETASWTEAFGRNIVNVILVDFRALDTFGEIAVVIVAALGAYALLKGKPRGEES
ncbi:MAG: putative monovalent cation/H+ antiporter subunit A [Pseudomonadota bacterium]